MVIVQGDGPQAALKLPAALHPLHVDTGLLLQPTRLAAAWMVHNPSIAVHDGRLRAVVRVLSRVHRASFIVVGFLDEKWQLTGARLVQDRVPGSRNMHGMTHGYEDCRLFSRRSRLCASATVCNQVPNDPRPKITVLDFDDVGDVVASHVQPSNRHEKNWMPVVDGDALRFVYSADPRIVLDYDDETHAVRPSACDVNLHAATLRGGSQLIPYESGFVSVVHEVHKESDGRYSYLHRLMLFDRELHRVRLSKPFYFHTLGIEFCAGLAQWNGSFVMSFGIADREACLAVVHRDVLRRMVES